MEQECAGMPQAGRRMWSFRRTREDPGRQRLAAFFHWYITASHLCSTAAEIGSGGGRSDDLIPPVVNEEGERSERRR